ncbi:MAG: hypothetical protein WBH60_08195 [Fervidobacterium sp.]
MKRHLWVILSTVIVLAVLFSCVKPEGPVSITLDGDLEDWGSLLYEDSNNDCVWGNDELYKAGITFDSTNLYIAGVYKKDAHSYNNFMCLADISSSNGATDTSKHPWNRSYAFSTGNIGLVVESWQDGFTAWQVTSDEFIEITNFATAVILTSEDTITTAEIQIPLSALGITDVTSLTVKAAFAITADCADGKQWVGDFYPEQSYTIPSDGGITGPATITNFIKFPK